jgi:hypothetical protein
MAEHAITGRFAKLLAIVFVSFSKQCIAHVESVEHVGVCSDGTMNCEWQNGGTMLEYTANANPRMTEGPVHIFPASTHRTGKTQLVALDLKDMLGLNYPATAPNLLASFLEASSIPT